MNSAKYRKSSQPDMVPRRRRQMWAASETDGSEEMDVTDGERGEKCSLSSGGYAACADNLAQEGLRSFFFPPLDEWRLQQRAGKCDSSGQALIFSLSFPPTQRFVDTVVLILSFLGWMPVPKKNQKPGNAVRRRGGRGTGTPALAHIPEG